MCHQGRMLTWQADGLQAGRCRDCQTARGLLRCGSGSWRRLAPAAHRHKVRYREHNYFRSRAMVSYRAHATSSDSASMVPSAGRVVDL